MATSAVIDGARGRKSGSIRLDARLEAPEETFQTRLDFHA